MLSSVGVLALAGFGALWGALYLSVATAAVAVYLVVGALSDLALRARCARRITSRRARALARSAALGSGTAIAHAGMGLTLLGLAATGWGVENITTMRVGDVAEVGPYQIALEDMTARQGPNYSESTPSWRCAPTARRRAESSRPSVFIRPARPRAPRPAS